MDKVGFTKVHAHNKLMQKFLFLSYYLVAIISDLAIWMQIVWKNIINLFLAKWNSVFDVSLLQKENGMYSSFYLLFHQRQIHYC